MKSKAKYDPIVIILIALIPVLLFVFGFIREGLSLNTFLLTGVVLFFVLITTVNSYYQLEEDYLVIRINAAKKRVPYSDIKSVTKGTSKVLFKTSYTTKGIIINTYSEGTFLIGPKELVEFFEELNKKL